MFKKEVSYQFWDNDYKTALKLNKNFERTKM